MTTGRHCLARLASNLAFLFLLTSSSVNIIQQSFLLSDYCNKDFGVWMLSPRNGLRNGFRQEAYGDMERTVDSKRRLTASAFSSSQPPQIFLPSIVPTNAGRPVPNGNVSEDRDPLSLMHFQNRLRVVRHVFFFSLQNANLSTLFCKWSEYGNGVLESVDRVPLFDSSTHGGPMNLTPHASQHADCKSHIFPAPSATIPLRPMSCKRFCPPT